MMEELKVVPFLEGCKAFLSPTSRKFTVFDNTANVPPPSVQEVQKAIQALRNNKSAGSDGIPAKLLNAC